MRFLRIRVSVLIQRYRAGISKNVEATGKTVISVDKTFFVHDGVIHLAGWRGIFRRCGRNVKSDFLQVWWRVSDALGTVDDVENPDPAVKPTGYRRVFEIGGRGAGKIRVQIMRAEPAAARAEIAVVGMERSGADDHGIGFGANIEQPDQLGRILAVVLRVFVRHQRDATAEDRLEGVGPGGVGRRKLGLSEHLGSERLRTSGLDVGEVRRYPG